MSLKALLHENNIVYVFLAHRETAMAFLRQADAEGFRFADGRRPVQGHVSDLMVLHSDGTLCYAGAVGRIAYQSGTACIGGKALMRVDYETFIHTA